MQRPQTFRNTNLLLCHDLPLQRQTDELSENVLTEKRAKIKATPSDALTETKNKRNRGNFSDLLHL